MNVPCAPLPESSLHHALGGFENTKTWRPRPCASGLTVAPGIPSHRLEGKSCWGVTEDSRLGGHLGFPALGQGSVFQAPSSLELFQLAAGRLGLGRVSDSALGNSWPPVELKYRPRLEPWQMQGRNLPGLLSLLTEQPSLLAFLQFLFRQCCPKPTPAQCRSAEGGGGFGPELPFPLSRFQSPLSRSG